MRRSGSISPEVRGGPRTSSGLAADRDPRRRGDRGADTRDVAGTAQQRGGQELVEALVSERRARPTVRTARHHRDAVVDQKERRHRILDDDLAARAGPCQEEAGADRDLHEQTDEIAYAAPASRHLRTDHAFPEEEMRHGRRVAHDVGRGRTDRDDRRERSRGQGRSAGFAQSSRERFLRRVSSSGDDGLLESRGSVSRRA